MIDFQKLKETRIEHFKGGEGYIRAMMYMGNNIKIMESYLDPGCTIGYHPHPTSSEIVFVLSGTAIFTLDGKDEIVTAGQCHYCPKGSSHSMRNASQTEPVHCYNIVPEQ